MSIPIVCPDCGKKYRFGDERAGETVECKECGMDIEIPGGRRRRGGGTGVKERKPQSSSAGAAVIIGGGIGAVVLVGVLLMGRGQQAVPPANNAQSVASDPVAPAQSTPMPEAAPSTATLSGTMPTPTDATQPNPTPPNPTQPTPAIPSIAANPNPTKSGGVAPTPNSGVAPPSTSDFNTGKRSNRFKLVKDWKVQVDPSPISLADEATKKFNIKTPVGVLQEEQVVYPETPSPLALIGQNGSVKESREVWNLLTGMRTSVVKGPRITGRKLGFSPDGKYVAWSRGEAGHNSVEVYDILGKKSLGTIKLDGMAFVVETVILPTSKRLVAISSVIRGIITFKLPSGDLEHQITLGQRARSDPHRAFSPGGRFLAVVSDFLTNSVEVYDLDAGEKSGTIEFADDSPTTDLLGMAFSYDGREFAAAYSSPSANQTERIVIWKVEDGSIVSDFELPGTGQPNHDIATSKSSLQWFPDGKRLLLNGTHVIDRDVSQVVFAFPKPSAELSTSRTRHVVADSMLAAWEGTTAAATLVPLELKEEDVSRAKEVAAAGGLLFDTKLPKLTAFNRGKAADRSSIRDEWSAAVDSPSRELTLTEPTPMRSSDAWPRELCCSGSHSGSVCIRFSDEVDETQSRILALNPKTHEVNGAGRRRTRVRIPPVPCRKNWLEFYDVINRVPAGRIDIKFPCELMAVSPDGTQALVQAIDSDGRLDVFMANGTHVAGCRPFQDDAEPKNREIVSASFLDTNTVAACSINDQLIVYRLPSCEPVYSVSDAGVLAVSPSGKLVASGGGRGLEFRDAMTGAGRGIVPCEGVVQAMSFSPKGDRLAALVNDRNGSAVIVVDLVSGAPTSLRVPQATVPLIWCGENEIILGNPVYSGVEKTSRGANVDYGLTLIDLNRKAVLWSYLFGTADHLAFGQKTFDGHFWLADSTGQGGRSQITAVNLLETVTKNQDTNANLEQQAIVRPGISISLQFDVTDPPSISGYAKDARTTLERVLKTNDLTVKDAQPVKLVVSIVSTPESGTATLEPLGGFGNGKPKSITVQRRAVEIRIAYEMDGSSVWESKRNVGNVFTGFNRIPEGKDAQTALDEAMWRQALSLLETNFPPSHIFPASASRGLGTSRLTDAGQVPTGR